VTAQPYQARPTRERPHPLPWYRFFWPWFIVVLLTTTVLSGIWTAVVAFQHADPLVRDDYYREGIAINRRFSAEHAARRLGIHATLHIGGGSAVVELAGESTDSPEFLLLELSHATLAERDRSVRLQRSGSRTFVGVVTGLSPGRFYATLKPDDGDAQEPWRLMRSITIPATDGFEFSAR